MSRRNPEKAFVALLEAQKARSVAGKIADQNLLHWRKEDLRDLETQEKIRSYVADQGCWHFMVRELRGTLDPDPWRWTVRWEGVKNAPLVTLIGGHGKTAKEAKKKCAAAIDMMAEFGWMMQENNDADVETES